MSEEKQVLLQLLEEKNRRIVENKIYNNFYFKEGTEFSINHYKKHKKFFEAGKEYTVRLFMAGNRIGKTESGGLYELVLHALGWYPNWWPGYKMDDGEDKLFVAVSKNLKASMEIIQGKLFKHNLGAEFGTGLLPKDCIIDLKRAQGVSGAYSSVTIKRKCGGQCTILFKSAEQGRGAFEGFEANLVLLDEEPPAEVYSEAITRTMTTKSVSKSIVMLTFTPLDGITKLIQEFEKDRNNPESPKYIVQACWDDAPHLTEKDKKEMLELYPEHEREARSKGIPMLGHGAIYPVSIDSLRIEPFQIPDYWPCWYGMDVGWNCTAVVFLTTDPESGITYIYDELYLRQVSPDKYIDQIMANGGDWMEGSIDYSANAPGKDGQSIRGELNKYGLTLHNADKRVEFGIFKTLNLMKSNTLKIFSHCENLIHEFGIYQRNDKGKIVKANDHALDAMRYGIMSAENIKKRKYETIDENESYEYDEYNNSESWMS